MTGFVSTVREDGTLRDTVLAAAVLAVLLRFAFGEPWTATAALVAVASAASLASEYADYRGVPSATRGVVLGCLLVALGAGWATSAGSVPALAGVAVLVGAWLALDGWTARDRDETGGAGDFDEQFDDGVVATVREFKSLGEVGRALDDGARTPEAVARRLGWSEREARDRLSTLEDAGVVERDGDEYERSQAGAGVRSWPRRALRRVARPFRRLAD